MSHCPSCGKKLHLYNIKPVCPECGVNLNYFNSNENLLDEAEKSEREHAKFQPKIDRAKKNTIFSWQGIVRLVLRVLPLGAIFLPLCQNNGENINALSIYNFVSTADIGSIISNIFSDFANLSLVFLLLSVVMILVNLFMLFASGGYKWKTRETAVISVFLGLSLLSAIFSPYSLKIGAYIYILLGILQMVWNIYLIKTAVPVVYTPYLPPTSPDYRLYKGLKVDYTPCHIGGLPSDEYFGLVEQGKTTEEIRRIMLPALAREQDAANKKREQEEAEKKAEEDRKHGIKS